jgi:hypothetical protein
MEMQMKKTNLLAIILFMTFSETYQPTAIAASNPNALPDKSENTTTTPPLSPTPTAKRLDVNDVSILFPLPTSPGDVDRLITIKDIKSISNAAVFPEADFRQIIALAESPASKIEDKRIGLEESIRSFSSWKVAGIRFDPTAPGASEEIRSQFGSRPQIRVILQPVTNENNNVTVQDVTIHIIYDYISQILPEKEGSVAKAVPDIQKVKAIVDDLLRLKKLFEDAGVNTNGPLSVHPGLLSPKTKNTFPQEIAAFLTKHLDASDFTGAAIMGLNDGGPEPWIFLSMNRATSNDSFKPLPGPGLGPVGLTSKAAQMINFSGDTSIVLPAPSTTNINAISNSLVVPTSERRGISTAVLFTEEELSAFAPTGVDASGKIVRDKQLTNADIPDWIANPDKSHFFNTDCISCHTETTRREILSIKPSPVAFKPSNGISGLDPLMKSSNRWNVRNFGWFESNATITQRTANETAEVVDFINTTILGR